jgi:hypothetical protein
MARSPRNRAPRLRTTVPKYSDSQRLPRSTEPNRSGAWLDGSPGFVGYSEKVHLDAGATGPYSGNPPHRSPERECSPLSTSIISGQWCSRRRRFPAAEVDEAVAHDLDCGSCGAGAHDVAEDHQAGTGHILQFNG